jgi:EH_Signature domain
MIAKAMERLKLDLHEFQASNLAQKLDPELYLNELTRTIRRLEQRLDSGVPPKPPMNAEEVWARWRLLGYDLLKLEKREVRSLCISPETALRPKLVTAIANHLEYLSRASTIFGMVNAYWHKWRSMEEPEQIELLIWSAISLDGMARRSKVIAQWGRHRFLFSSEAANGIAQIVVRDRKAMKLVCADLFIDPNTELARQSHVVATEQAVRVLLSGEATFAEERALQDLRWIIAHLAAQELSHETFRISMAKLILSKLPDRCPSFQRALTEVVHGDNRMGDPRLPDRAVNWRTLPDEARARFVSWIAGETLQFFFETLVPRNDENRRRADFWLQYVKRSRNLKDFQVAVSREDETKIKAIRAKTMPSYSRIKNWDSTSAFLMVFQGYGKDYVIIEFSETGNAAYIYEKSVFEAKGARMRSFSYDLNKDLKRITEVKQRILHLGAWEHSARSKLAELGIRP